MRDEITVNLDSADIAEVYKPVPRRTRLSRLVLLFALTLLVLIVVLLVRFPEARPAVREDPLIVGMIGAITLVVLVIVVLLATAPWVRRHVGRSTLADHPGMSDPIRYAFDEEQFAVQGTYSQAHYPWELLWSWRETGRVIIVQPTPRNFYVIPKRGIDPQILGRLRARLAQCRKSRSRSIARPEPSPDVR